MKELKEGGGKRGVVYGPDGERGRGKEP